MPLRNRILLVSFSKWSTSPSHEAAFKKQKHSYATLASDDEAAPKESKGHNGNAAKEHTWPQPTAGHPHPSPYAIFAMKNNAEYTKARYYELVKLYHPDLRQDSSNKSIAHHVKMERYRLIVAAHGILSDPIKRRAYDRFGAGWNGKADAGNHESHDDRPGPFTQHNWTSTSSTSPEDPSIFANATWEDWEAYYARQAQSRSSSSPPQPQTPLYLRNTHFLALVALVALIGCSANYKRAEDAGTYFLEQRDIVHDRAAKELRRVRQETKGLNARDERIEWFVLQREATLGLGDVEALREEKAGRVLGVAGEREICRSEDLRARDG